MGRWKFCCWNNMGGIELAGLLQVSHQPWPGLCQWSRSATAMGHPMSFRETPGVISAQCSDSPDGHLDTSPPCIAIWTLNKSKVRSSYRCWHRQCVDTQQFWGWKPWLCFSYMAYLCISLFLWENGKTHEEGVCVYIYILIYILVEDMYCVYRYVL